MAEEIESELSAIKFALKSFIHYSNDVERTAFLKNNFNEIPNLDIYCDFNKEELKSALQQKEEQRTGEVVDGRSVLISNIDNDFDKIDDRF
jgi:hypothetical protein